MTIKINGKYILRFNVNGVNLIYHGRIIDVDDSFIEFVDKFNKIISYNIKNLISYEEVKNE